ncbi:MAG: T9SS type A sorting domain-containing protein [Bacteroidetes bacterium]|nr:T9SS type A sorting domain-containing protein [Bacteroidota bacterium]MCL1968376.1 T9SS type A sorting domain-containing protein [Bacteroidota bacterium]
MKKNILLLVLMILFTGSIFAQATKGRTLESPRNATVSSYDIKADNHSRSLIYTEGFESTVGSPPSLWGPLPQDWTTSATGVWITAHDTIPGIIIHQTPHSGERFMVRSWNATGAMSWAFSSGIQLTAGADYTISFWFKAPGYPNANEYDDFEVRIGQTATAQGMSNAHLLFSNIHTLVVPWTQVECSFTPSATGSYYLGFHDLTPSQVGYVVMIDDIEISEALCPPVNNLVANYSTDCSKANLTWDAPGSGNFTYQILRDDEEIARVTTESYTDSDFEPTLEYVWSVRVVCDDNYSITRSVYKTPCTPPSCGSAKNLSVTYGTTCDEALLEWKKSTEVLWNNSDGYSMYGRPSVRWLMEELSRVILADDFIVPNGETWTISEVFTAGFYNDYEAPQYLGVEIFKDEGGHPGEQIYEEFYITPLGGSMTGFLTLVLPEPLVVTSGKYWVSSYGVYEGEDNDNRLYYIHMCTTPVGSVFYILNESSGNGWEATTGEYPSLYFRIQGSKTIAEPEYNVYRDGELIATKITDLSFSDKTFDPNVGHKWSVKVACPAGDLSAPIYVTKEKCGDVGVNETKTKSFTIVPNPATDKITITANNNFNTIEVINFLGQTVISQSNILNSATTLDVAHLNSGVYFVRIASETGTSVQKFVKR